MVARNKIPVKSIIKGILHHHERFNGKGYPEGLKGEDIHIYGRIIAIADALDAMLNPRIYRPNPLTLDEALGEMQIHAGQQFDPYIVSKVVSQDFESIKRGIYQYGSHCIG